MITSYFVAIALTASAIGQTSSVTYVQTMSTGLTYPARIAAGPSGAIYVTDPPGKAVVAHSAAGAFLASYPITQGPIGIAVHNDGRVFISRADGKIGVYSAAFAALGVVNPSPLALNGPNDIAFDPTAQELYSVDSGSHRILVFAESAPGVWSLARSWGMEGTGLGQFSSPQSIAFDANLSHVLVTDADNFRVQVFNTTGILLFKFGYRMLYTSTSDTAWFARSEGLAVDGCSNIYVTDALMGTLRVFSNTGKELSATNIPAIAYGTAAGQLRSPCGLLIDQTGMLYVANTNNNSVEAYSVTCTVGTVSTVGPPAPRGEAGKKMVRAGAVRQDPASISKRMPDSPLDVLLAVDQGEYSYALDLNSDGVVDSADVNIAVDAFGMGTVEDFESMAGLSNVAEHPTLSPPHVLDLPNRCGRCHSMDGTPGGMLTSSGQENLCQSCHSAGKIAGNKWVGPGNNLNSHPWGVVPDDLDPQSDLALHLDNGNMRCGTCHEPHVNQGGMDFMRIKIYDTVDVTVHGFTPPADRPMTVMDATLCGQCHTDIVSQWHGVGHADITADPWSHYDWSMGNNWLCTGPGTPYDYCTDEGAGTVSAPANAICVSAGNPLACCTGSGTGTCTISNASCTGLGTPRPCCLGPGTGNCIANSACTAAGVPSPCCTGTGTGTCSNALPAAMCVGVNNPNPCCTGAGAGSCSDRSSCRQCHSGNGFIDYSKDFPDGTVVGSTHRGSLRVIDCLVCHSTHGTSQDGKLLRIYDTVRLPTGQVFNDQEGGATCMACHNGRAVPPTNPSSVSTPHYLNGAAMLEGINAVNIFPAGAGAVTYALSNSNHTTNAALNCTTCHMAPGPTSGPEVGMVGGHSFRLKNHDSGFENVANSCATSACHPGLTTINRTANGDYDGDGVTEGIQDETRGLLGLLKDALYAAGASRLLLNADTGLPTTEADLEAEATNPYWTLRRCSGGTRDGLACNGTGGGTAPFDCSGGTCNATVPTGDRTTTVINAIWNWEFVDNSGDLGVKNTGYAIGLLQIAYKGVTSNPVPGASYRYSPAP